MTSLCILIPYFGRWPFWMPFFLESCRWNPSVHWHFFTDCGEPNDLPDNVRIQSIRYEDYLSFVSGKLEIDFHPVSNYKLCDIKPAYGFLHEETIKEYDFWGFGDIDLVCGNLRAYFTEGLLRRHDLISNHERRISGHLCLIRNNARMNHAFRKIPDWQRLFCGPHEAVDERAFSRIFIRWKNLPKPLLKFVRLFNPWWHKSLFREAYSTPRPGIIHQKGTVWIDGSRNYPSRWFWKQGRIFNDKDGSREFPYFHFMDWKYEWSKQVAPPPPPPMQQLARQPCWQISARGFGEIHDSEEGLSS